MSHVPSIRSSYRVRGKYPGIQKWVLGYLRGYATWVVILLRAMGPSRALA